MFEILMVKMVRKSLFTNLHDRYRNLVEINNHRYGDNNVEYDGRCRESGVFSAPKVGTPWKV